MKTLWGKLVLLVVCFFLFVPAPVKAADTQELVILVYMTGSDLESNGSSASTDLEEIMRFLPENKSIRIVVMASGARKWRLDISPNETSVYEVTRDGLAIIQQNPSMNMGNPDTLAGFLTFTKEQYPADQYGLIIWDHGAGPLAGVCFDEMHKDTAGNLDALTAEELGTAMAASPFREKKLAFVGFDACLMATLEVAYVMSPYAEYMIASQETEPSTGWNYDFLHSLTGTETGSEIGQLIIASYEASLAGIGRPLTLSCLDLSRVESVCSTLGTFFADLEPSISSDTYPDYTRCRSDSKALGSSTNSSYDLIDLIDLISLYQETGLADGSDLIKAIREMIVCQFSANINLVNGVSIYYPFDNKTMYGTSWSAAYQHMSFVPEYQSFIRKISDIYMGDALINWKSVYQTALQESGGTVRISLDLTPEEAQNISRARMLVVEKMAENYYQRIYTDYDRLHVLDDRLTSVYHGEALYVVDDNGEILAGPVTWYPADGNIVVYGEVMYDIDFSIPFDQQKLMDPVRLIYAWSDDGSLILRDIMVIVDSGLYLPSGIDLSACTDLFLVNAGPSAVTLLDDMVYSDSIRLDPSNGAPNLAILPVYGTNDRYAYILMTDMQGNSIHSEVKKIPNPTLISLSPPRTIISNEQFELSLESADLVTGYSAGIKCIFQFANHTDKTWKISVQGASINGVPLDQSIWYPALCRGGDKDDFMAFFSAASIRSTGLSEADILTITFFLDSDVNDEIHSVSIPLQLNTALFAQ